MTKDEIFINPSNISELPRLDDCDYYFAIAAKQKDLKSFNNYVEKHHTT